MRTPTAVGALGALALAIAAAGAGCKKEPGTQLGAPSAPASTKDQDALWALAPRGAIFGVVGSPRGVALIERGGLALRALIAAAPEFAPARGELDQALTEVTGTAAPTLADVGLSHDKGFALFMTRDDDAVIVVPLGDRAKFLAKVHGTKGTNGDTLKKGLCKTVDAFYVCAKKPALFGELGKASLDPVRTSAGTRGDLEFAGANFTGSGGPSVAGVIQLERGTFLVRGVVSGVPHEVTDMIGTPSRPRDGSATAGGFGTIDLAPFLAQLPPLPIAPGVTLAQLGKSVSGPATFVIPAGTLDLGIRIPLGDPAPAKSLVEHCADLPPLASLGATVKDGGCHVTIPRMNTALDAWVEGKDLRIGTRGAPQGTPVTPSPIATELAQNPWSIALFGRGSLVDLKGVPGATEALQTLPPEAQIGLRVLPLFSELGLGLRKDGDALRFFLGVRTAWANPDDVIDKVLAISSDQILSGKAAELARSIAAGSPDSPFAQDVKVGPAGAMGLLAPVGIVAAVAIPAFMDYMKRSKKTEAALQLNKLGKNAKRAYSETSEFPRGEAPLTTAAPCCGQRDNHCQSSPKDWQHPVWQALDFEIDEPSLFQYSYQSDGKTFVAKAIGDLDCDGIMITYELRGTSDNGNPMVTLTEPPPGAD